MSTIAYDGNTLAGDRMCTVGNTPMPFQKIGKINGMTFGCAGYAEDTVLFAEWVKTGMIRSSNTVPKLSTNFHAICIDANGDVYLYFEKLVPIPHQKGKPWAFGSGGEFAMGAMAMGATAKDAVEIATQFDINTGLGVDVIKLDSKAQKGERDVRTDDKKRKEQTGLRDAAGTHSRM